MVVKVVLLAVILVAVILFFTGGCVMFFMGIFGCKSKETPTMEEKTNATESDSVPDYDGEGSSMMFSSEGVTAMPGGDGSIDDLFPDHVTDGLKLKLILKALDILKTLDGEDPEYVNSLLPGNDEMTDELKVHLILKAISLLEDKPLTSMFCGHVVAELKLTLLLKAISILKDVRVDPGMSETLNELKFSLVRKALYILKKYKGNFKDTVFNTKSRLHLKLKLSLLYLSLSKTVRRHTRDVSNFWLISGSQSKGDGQSEATARPTVRIRIDNGGLIPDEVTTPKITSSTEKERKIPKTKKNFLKTAKFFKLLSKVLHKRRH